MNQAELDKLNWTAYLASLQVKDAEVKSGKKLTATIREIVAAMK